MAGDCPRPSPWKEIRVETPTIPTSALAGSPRRRRVAAADPATSDPPIPGARFDVPFERDFYHDQFIEAPELQKLGTLLIGKWPELSQLHQVRIRYLWR